MNRKDFGYIFLGISFANVIMGFRDTSWWFLSAIVWLVLAIYFIKSMP